MEGFSIPFRVFVDKLMHNTKTAGRTGRRRFLHDNVAA